MHVHTYTYPCIYLFVYARKRNTRTNTLTSPRDTPCYFLHIASHDTAHHATARHATPAEIVCPQARCRCTGVQVDTMIRTSTLNPWAALGSVYSRAERKIGVQIGPQLRVLTQWRRSCRSSRCTRPTAHFAASATPASSQETLILPFLAIFPGRHDLRA